MNHVKAMQEALREAKLDGILLTDEKNQYYALGFSFTDGAVLIGREKAWLITDSRYVEAAAAAVSGWAEVVLFDAARSLAVRVSQRVQQAGIRRLGVEESSLSHAAYLRWQEQLDCQLVGAQNILTQLRTVKDKEELDSLKLAQQISERALLETLPYVKEGVTERELAAELVYRMMKNGGERCSFDPIVLTGVKTSMPHGVPGEARLQKGSFLTLDFGCVKNGYCSDMTRTFALGTPTEEMINVYEIVLEAQCRAINTAKAGISGRELDAAARSYITDKGYGAYFGHSFGHGVGLDVHENPTASPSNTQPLPEGAVISAEPGIYLPGQFGVRIEDVLVIREHSCENLTKFPKELTVLQG